MSVKIGRNDHCWCGSGRKYKTCHQSFDEKIEKYREAGCIVPTHDLIKTPKDIEGIRESAKINVAVLDYVAEHIKAGMSTEEIDRMVYEKKHYLFPLATAEILMNPALEQTPGWPKLSTATN